MSRVILGGGSGFIGRALNKHLTEKGYKVTLISRSPGKGKLTWDEISKDGLPACHAVVNLAGENIMNPLRRWNEGFLKDLFDSRIKTTTTLAEAISRMPQAPKAFVSSSAIGYYPFSETEEFTENYSGPPADFARGLVPKWEKCVQLPESHNHVRQVVIRIGLVLGNDGGALQSMRIPFYLGFGGVIGSGKQILSWIHIDDMVGIFTHAIESESVTGVLNGTAPEPATNYEFTKAYGSALWRPTMIPVPSLSLNLLYGEERASMLLQGARIIPERTELSGYRFKFRDINSALRDLCS